jgi:hypothetical protein
MSIKRVVPDVVSARIEESRKFYAEFLGFDVATDMGWEWNRMLTFSPHELLLALLPDITGATNYAAARGVPQFRSVWQCNRSHQHQCTFRGRLSSLWP